jgi:uncharacterized lipoprotein YbaY
MRWQTSATLTFATLIAASSAAASEFVVVDAASAPVQSGQVIKGADKIALPAGAVVTVIGETGTVTKLNGPVSGTLDALAGASASSGGEGAGVVGTISRLLQSGNAAQGKSLLTVRNVATPGMRPQGDANSILSVVDVLNSGSYCIAATVQPVLARERAADFKTVRLTDAASGKVVIVEFPSQVASVPWPAGLAVTDGAVYTAQAYDSGTTLEFTLYRIPANLPSDAHRIAWMVDRGCLDQARSLLQQVASAGPAT